jgi:2-C-methyl-D-erythritol 4-phosphate cytidylyltransferase
MPCPVSGNPFKTVAVIPAAGLGVRMGSARPKQFINLEGMPILAVTLRSFHRCRLVDAIIIVVPNGDVEYCRKEIVQRHKLDRVKKVVPGGDRRQDSVRLGLAATGGEYDLVVIHDGVRPMISPEIIERLIDAAKTHRAIITGLPAKDTIKEVDSANEVVLTHDRERLWLIQTPQAFRYKDIWEAHQMALEKGWEEATDDSVLIERMGIPVKVVKGSENNIKVTTPGDLELARFWLRSMRE